MDRRQRFHALQLATSLLVAILLLRYLSHVADTQLLLELDCPRQQCHQVASG